MLKSEHEASEKLYWVHMYNLMESYCENYVDLFEFVLESER